MRDRILPILALLLAVIVFFGYTNPTYSGSIAEQKAAIASDDGALKAAADYAQKASELAALESTMDQGLIDRAKTLLPDSVDNVGVILDLDALAARTGVTLVSINVAQPAAGSNTGDAIGHSPVASVDLTLSAKGTYGAFRTFLTGLESSERLLDVTDLSVSGSDTGVYTYQITARLYWLR